MISLKDYELAFSNSPVPMLLVSNKGDIVLCNDLFGRLFGDVRERIAHEERLKTAMDAAATAMIMVDKSGSIILANVAASTLFGYEESELLGSSVDRLVPRNVQSVHSDHRNSYMVTGTARSMAANLDLCARHADEHDIPVTVALTPVDTSDGKAVVTPVLPPDS